MSIALRSTFVTPLMVLKDRISLELDVNCRGPARRKRRNNSGSESFLAFPAHGLETG
jgi:hypothetical protein